MFLPPSVSTAADHAGSTAAGPNLLPLTGYSSSNAQDAVVAADTRGTHPSQSITYNGNHLLFHVWEWAASQVTNWVNHSASSASPTSRRSSSDSSNDTAAKSHKVLGLLLLRKRAASQNLDATIGVVVGVLLGAFLLGTLAFCIVYRNSIRFKRKKKFQRHRRHHHHHKSGGSKSSKSSRSSDSSASSGGGGGGGDAEAAPAPAPEPAPAEGG